MLVPVLKSQFAEPDYREFTSSSELFCSTSSYTVIECYWENELHMDMEESSDSSLNGDILRIKSSGAVILG
ncbi:Serine/threonine-protein kinase [Dirofilaria immitis]